MRFRWSFMALAIIASLFVLFKPSDEEDGWTTPNINLGLDLQGGIFMQLEVDVVDALNQYIEENSGTIKAGLEGDDYVVESSDFDLDKRTISLNGVTSSDKDVLKELKDLYSFSWSINRSDDNYTLRLKDSARTRVQNEAVDQAVSKIQNRIDELGVTEPVINRTINSNRIILELAGADDVQRVHNIVREPGKLEWRLVDPQTRSATSEAELLRQVGGTLPPNTKIFPLPTPGEPTQYMLLQEVKLTAKDIQNVFATQDDRGLPAVGINLNRDGGQVFNQLTSGNVGNFLAVVLDKKILSAPRINSVLGARFIIQGSFTIQEVNDMVIKIKSGSLPAKISILEERVIGPTLGRDARNQGAFSAILGLLLVIIFMLIWYSRAGLYSVFALFMNLVIISGLLSAIGAVLTLPGIAGFILTIGMAVDANVLVFERIREEIREGLIPRKAVDVGFKTAFTTIMDANVTTFIAAFCLLLMGQGPIKGFSVMLMIGIVSSIFTAVFCSRTFFLEYLARKQPEKIAIWPLFRLG